MAARPRLLLAFAAGFVWLGATRMARADEPEPEAASPGAPAAEATSAPPATDGGTASGPASGQAAPTDGTSAPNSASPPTAPAAPPRQFDTTPAPAESGFRFGSYGRVSAASDLGGRTPSAQSITSHPPRIVENTYVELELRHTTAARGWRLTTTITPAIVGEPFHYTGTFDSTIAVRNLNLSAQQGGLSLWAGSRMVRGDDIYLLDYWPLDNLNLVGGGAGYVIGDLELKVHTGTNRLLDPYQHQTVAVPDVVFGAETIEKLDRQRVVGAAKASYTLRRPPELGLKVVAYLEGQGIGGGRRERPDGTILALPADGGLVVGAQLGAYGFGPGARGHANLFLRMGLGLAATDWLGVPEDVGVSRKTWGAASEFVVGLSLNHELGEVGVQLGGYARRFVSAAPDPDSDSASGVEAVANVRPWFHLSGPWAVALDLSYQGRFPNGIDPSTLKPVTRTVLQAAPILTFTPTGPGSYSRPQLRLVYRVAHLDEGARAMYSFEDPRRDDAWVHYLGLQAEWWFDSSYQ
jgi:maltoporin